MPAPSRPADPAADPPDAAGPAGDPAASAGVSPRLPAAPEEPLRVVAVLWLLCLAAVTHGSLYPWLFEPAAPFARGWSRLWSTRWWTGTGDVVANILLFLPLGAMTERLLRALHWPAAPRLLAMMAGGLLFAWLLQLLQIWLPQRSPAVSDVLWNGVGLLLGWPLAGLLDGPARWLRHLWHSPLRPGLAMGALWLAIAWWPLLPSLSRWQLRDSLTRLDSLAALPPPSLLPAVGLAVVLHLLRGASWRGGAALALPLLALLGQFFFAFRPGGSTPVLGWLLGTLAGAFSWRLARPAADRLLLTASLAALLVGALWPWQWSAVAGPFHALPFEAILGQQRVRQSAGLLWVLFGTVAVLGFAQRLGLPPRPATLALMALLLALEILQRWMPAQTADLTPVLLPLLAAALLRLDRQAARPLPPD